MPALKDRAVSEAYGRYTDGSRGRHDRHRGCRSGPPSPWPPAGARVRAEARPACAGSSRDRSLRSCAEERCGRTTVRLADSLTRREGCKSLPSTPSSPTRASRLVFGIARPYVPLDRVDHAKEEQACATEMPFSVDQLPKVSPHVHAPIVAPGYWQPTAAPRIYKTVVFPSEVTLGLEVRKCHCPPEGHLKWTRSTVPECSRSSRT
jgi:hypothetical protein